MIVSGLPTRNGDQHAGEICTTAMDLLLAIETFKIRHMKDTKMRLRIGVHTGNFSLFIELLYYLKNPGRKYAQKEI